MHPLIRSYGLTLLTGIVLSAVAYLVYSPGLSGPFVFDDLSNILANPTLHNIKPGFASFYAAAQSNDSGLLGRPLSMLSFAINAALFQFDTYYYKLTNLMIHIFNGLLLGTLAYRLLNSLNQRQQHAAQVTSNHLRLVSLLATGLWLYHPLNLTTVLYVVQRMNSLATLFIVAGLLCYVIGRERVLSGNKTGLWLLLTLPLWTVLAVFSKENGALLPAFVLLIEVLVFRFKAAPTTGKAFRWLFALTVALPIMAGLLLLIFKLDAFLDYTRYPFTLEQRFLTETRVLWFYLSLIVIPNISRMGLYHDDFALSTGLLEPFSTLPAIAGIIALIALAIALRNRAPLIALGIFWYFLGHSLESSIFPLELIHEHRNYLPQFGLILALVFYVLYPYQRRQESTNNAYAQHAFIIIFTALAAYGNYARAQHWQTSWSLAAQEVRAHPNSIRANTQIAALLHEKKRYDLALNYLVRAVNLDPADPKTRLRLIQHLFQSGQSMPETLLQETTALLPKATLVDPEILHTFVPLLLVTTAEPNLSDRLISMYEGYLTTNKANNAWRLFAYHKLIDVYRIRQKQDKALFYLQESIKLGSPLPAHYLEAAEILIAMGQREKAGKILDTMQSSNILLKQPDVDRLNTLQAKLK